MHTRICDIKILIVFLAPFFIFIGCSTFSPTLLPSNNVYRSSPTQVPTLGNTSGGLHPYVGLSYGNIEFDGQPSLERINEVLLFTGLTIHPDIIDKKIIPFISLDGLVSRASIDVSSFDSSESVVDLYNMSSVKTGYSFEGRITPGAFVTYKGAAFSIYMLGIVKYELGEYYSFRKLIDGYDSLYNMCYLPMTFSRGFGWDTHIKVMDTLVIGNVFEICDTFNHTQSYYLTDEQADQVITRANGDSYRKHLVKLEPYIEYRKIRLSYSLYVGNNSYVSLTYRF